MSQIQCASENEVRQACRSDVWTPALREHARHCAACTEIVIVAGFLLHEAEIARLDAQLPSSSLVWWRAQLAANNEALTRATRPITLVAFLSVLAGTFGLLWFVIESAETTAVSSGVAKHLQYLQSLYANSTALMVTTGTLLCLLFGSLYLVCRE